ncbi:MAG: FtsX-like permease family protein, partial [Balneolaceae bacterium]|nr:FtsX-like permease family protein [Balneolaceae bacterium]
VDSVISIGGLAVGLACCILLIFYVRFEWTYDDFHENRDRIYRITDQITNDSGEIQRSLITPYPLTTALDSMYPEVETAALKYFGRTQVIGEDLVTRIQDSVYTYTVSAIAHEPPVNSSFQFEVVLPFESYMNVQFPERRQRIRESWYQGYGETWVMLHDRSSASNLEHKFPKLLEANLGTFATSQKMKLGLQSLNDIHFDQDYQSYYTSSTNVTYTLILGGIAIVILAIAGINFISLTLSRASNRNHEIGMRKSIGAYQNQIRTQIFGEVFVTCSIALILGLFIAELASPFFQQLTEQSFRFEIISDPVLWGILAIVLLIITLITGSYPALRISGRNAADLFSSQRSAVQIPVFVKGLICLQFALSISFMIITFVMQEQLQYITNKDVGFSTKNVIAVEINTEDKSEVQKITQVFKQEAQHIPGVQSISVTGGKYRKLPYMTKENGFGMTNVHSSSTIENLNNSIIHEYVDENYIETLDIKLIEGRNFSPERASELVNGVIINQQFAEAMGWQNPVGQIIREDSVSWTPPFAGKQVIGIVENYHVRPLYQDLRPMALVHLSSSDWSMPRTILVKTTLGNTNNTIQKLSSLWNNILPEETFNYSFMDDLLMYQYQEEKRWSRIMKLSSTMAILLACFGLFGLAALSTKQRTKEIGIRKVFGATIANIVLLLSTDFAKLVLTGFVIAIPLGGFIINQWLTDFAYRIEIGPGIFALAGGTAFAIALLTVSWQSIKAAMANPVDSLRNE